jgi:hypothetical protein
MDPEQIWADVCRLENFAAPLAIACCEVAFARIAIMKYVCRQTLADETGPPVLAAVDRLMNESFSGDDEEAERFYHVPLRNAALEAVRAYSTDARNPVHVGALLLSRIECRRSPEIINMFRTFGNDVIETLRGLRVRPSATAIELAGKQRFSIRSAPSPHP